MVGEFFSKGAERGDAGGGALHVGVVNHDVPERLRRVDVLQPAVRPRVLVRGPAAAGALVLQKVRGGPPTF